MLFEVSNDLIDAHLSYDLQKCSDANMLHAIGIFEYKNDRLHDSSLKASYDYGED